MARIAAACAVALLLLGLAGLALRSEGVDRGRSLRSSRAPRRSLATLPSQEGSDYAVIEFTGAGHFDTTRWSATASGVWEKRNILRRPSWQKTIRCAGSSPGTCEECWERDACWSAGAGSRLVTAPSTSNWTRFVSTIHVRCEAPILRVRYDVFGVRRGELRMYWNGKQVRRGASGIDLSGLALPVYDANDDYLARVPMANRKGSVDIAVERFGANALELEFLAYGTGPGGAELATLELQMPEDFAQCEDFKACLDPLAAGSPGAIRLRNSNALQLACMEADVAPNEECARWLGCLTPHKRSQLITLLKAAGVGEHSSPLAIVPATAEDSFASNTTGEANATTTTTTTTTTYGSLSVAATSCINPLLQDVESWSCDCFEEMQLRCRDLVTEYSEEDCMRAQICEHPSVCEDWKAASCSDASLTAVREKLQGGAASERRLKQSLLHRARGPVAAMAPAPGEAVDRALGGKHCV